MIFLLYTLCTLLHLKFLPKKSSRFHLSKYTHKQLFLANLLFYFPPFTLYDFLTHHIILLLYIPQDKIKNKHIKIPQFN